MTIKFYGKSQEVCQNIVNQFKSGDLPDTLTNVFVSRSDSIPSAAWSYMNRFIMAIHGTQDARGFKQWGNAGRKVSKGSRAIYILGPCIKKFEDDEGNEKSILYGFKSIPVFAIESTEISDPEKWEKEGGIDHGEENRLMDLPFREVAEAWGINVTSYNGKGAMALGYYAHNGIIALGTENLATWTHELCHAADDRNGTLTKKPGQQVDNEIVAEVGGAVLLSMIGEEKKADLGGAWEYVLRYSKGDPEKAVNNCMKFIKRICEVVDHIVEAATNYQEQIAA